MVKREDFLPREMTLEDMHMVDIFKKAAAKINKLFIAAVDSGDKVKASQLFARIKKINQTLRVEYGKRATVRIPEEYVLGASYINSVAGNGGVVSSVTLSATENRVKIIEGMARDLGPTHIDAIRALINDSKNLVYASIDKSESNILYNITKVHNIHIKERLAVGIAAGEAVSSIKKDFMKELREKGVSGFRDRSGRFWSTERYADMIVRTENRIANTQGTINRGLQLGYTTYKVIEQEDACSICQVHRNQIYDISKGSVELPPYHPNCRGYIIVYQPNLDKFLPSFML